MVARLLRISELKCFLCGAVSGRVFEPAAARDGARRLVQISPECPNGPRRRGGRLACCFCGGSLYVDSVETELYETQKVYPRERRGRPPKSARREIESG